MAARRRRRTPAPAQPGTGAALASSAIRSERSTLCDASSLLSGRARRPASPRLPAQAPIRAVRSSARPSSPGSTRQTLGVGPGRIDRAHGCRRDASRNGCRAIGYQGNQATRTCRGRRGDVNEKSLFVAGLLTYGIAKLVDAPRTTTDIALHTTESIFIASATATVIRGMLGRSRPFVTADSDAYDYNPGKGFTELAYRAYPSIHAASAFATAGALTAETARHSRRAAYFVGPHQLLARLAAGTRPHVQGQALGERRRDGRGVRLPSAGGRRCGTIIIGPATVSTRSFIGAAPIAPTAGRIGSVSLSSAARPRVTSADHARCGDATSSPARTRSAGASTISNRPGPSDRTSPAARRACSSRTITSRTVPSSSASCCCVIPSDDRRPTAGVSAPDEVLGDPRGNGRSAARSSRSTSSRTRFASRSSRTNAASGSTGPPPSAPDGR